MGFGLYSKRNSFFHILPLLLQKWQSQISTSSTCFISIPPITMIISLLADRELKYSGFNTFFCQLDDLLSYDTFMFYKIRYDDQ